MSTHMTSGPFGHQSRTSTEPQHSLTTYCVPGTVLAYYTSAFRDLKGINHPTRLDWATEIEEH